MKRLLNKIITPLAAFSIVTPIACITTSCSNAELKGIKLSAYPQYITKGQSLQIFADPQPASARLKGLKWEMTVPEELKEAGFSISQGGLITAPSEFTCSDPLSLTVTATYTPDPEIKATLDVMVLEEADENFLGFLDNKIEFLNRRGEGPAYATIEKTDKTWTDPSSGKEYTTVYEAGFNKEDPINLFAQRDTDYINFTPIFKPGVNTRMKYHIYHSVIVDGEEQEVDTHCIKWQPGYQDGRWTDTIPTPFALNAEFRTDEIHVVPHEAQDTILKIKLNIYQPTVLSTSGIFKYFSDHQGQSDQHQIVFDGLGVYNSWLLCPSTEPAVDPEYHMGDIYCFRSPKEYLHYDKIEYKPVIDKTIFDVQIGEIEETNLPSDPNYPAYKFDLDYKIDWSEVPKDGEQKWIGTIYAYDTEIDPEPAARLDLFIQWINE